MKDIKVLDCTLRDGGFVNDFCFGEKTIRGVFDRLSKANIDIIEVGYLYDKQKFGTDYTRFASTDAIKQTLKNKTTKSMVVAIVDFGDCDQKNIKNVSETNLNGIRVTFKKKDIKLAAEFCKKLKEKGFLIFMQPVSVTTYSDQEMLDLAKLVNDVAPYAVSIVDTYGLMHSEKVLHYFDLLDSNLNPDIRIGFHSHNNFQLAYTNCIELTKVQSNRPLILDTSCYGMGKSAGNACTELVCMYLNENHDKNYQLSEILEIIDTNIMPFYQDHPWGYNYEYYIAAQAQVHPKYVQFLEKKHTLSVSNIDDILHSIPDKVKLTFNEKLIEDMYLDYQDKCINDRISFQNLKKLITGQNILLLGPGNSLNDKKEDLQKFIANQKPFIISINCAPSAFPIDLVFLSNIKRYEQLEDEISGRHLKTAGTSNITPLKPFDFTFNYAQLISEENKVKDTSLLISLKILEKLSIKEVCLAGFDGFSSGKKNFYSSYLEVSKMPYNPEELTDSNGKNLSTIARRIKLLFITPSIYQRYIENEKI